MVNSKQIGRTSVNLAKEIYEKQGYSVSIIERTGKFIKYKDAFSEWFEKVIGEDGGFDLLAIHPSRTPILIQVTTTKPKVHKIFKQFASEFGHTIWAEQFVRIKGQKNNKRITYFYDNSYTISEVSNEGKVISTKRKK